MHVRRGVNLKLYQGEVSAIVGPSGCGKSTLLYLLGLLDRQDSGQILIKGEEIPPDQDGAHTRTRGEHIGFVFQFHFLLPEFSSGKRHAANAEAGKIGRTGNEDRARSLLSDVGLGDKTHPATFSIVRWGATTRSDCPFSGKLAERFASR